MRAGRPRIDRDRGLRRAQLPVPHAGASCPPVFERLENAENIVLKYDLYALHKWPAIQKQGDAEGLVEQAARTPFLVGFRSGPWIV